MEFQKKTMRGGNNLKNRRKVLITEGRFHFVKITEC
jgi:hypothetical protein